MKVEKVTARHVARKAYRTKILISVLAIALASVMLLLFAIYAMGMLSEQKGIFEIKAYGKDEGTISLSTKADFSDATVFLEGDPVEQITNISELRDIPSDVDTSADGSHNGENYFAYTFYLKNSSEVEIDVEEKVDILGKMKDADEAIRLKIYRNGIPTTYAAPAKSGMSEYGTISFLDEDTAYSHMIEGLAPGETVKYTVVVWLEGDDPECVDNIRGGFVRFGMNFKVISVSDKNG